MQEYAIHYLAYFISHLASRHPIAFCYFPLRISAPVYWLEFRSFTIGYVQLPLSLHLTSAQRVHVLILVQNLETPLFQISSKTHLGPGVHVLSSQRHLFPPDGI